MQASLTLYQIETVPVPILDMNNRAQFYMQLKIIKTHIALNDETYISLRSQELNTCKRPSYKRLICTYNNNIPVNIPSYLYVLLDRNILCNCDIDAEDNFLLESLVACGENNIQKLEMFFTVNLAFLDHLEDLTEVLDMPIDRNWMHVKQILPISLESFEINSSLLQAPKTLKDYIKQFQEYNNKLQVNMPHHNTKSNFKGFISGFIADIIGIGAALLTIITALVVI